MELTRYLAIYAAALSTAVFLWNVLRARPRFKVKLILGLDKTNDVYTSGIYLSLQNPSAHKVHITSVEFVYPYRKMGMWAWLKHVWEFKRVRRRIGWVYNAMVFDGIETGLPLSLEPGQSHMIFVPYDAVDEMLKSGISRKLVAGAQDALWRSEYSSVFDFPVMRDPDKGDDESDEDSGIYLARGEPVEVEEKKTAPEDAAS